MSAALARLKAYLSRRIERYIDRLRLRLAQPDALLQITALGVIAGLFAASVVVAFRLLLAYLQINFLGLPGAERYEALPAEWRFLVPAVGALILGVAFQFLPPAYRNVGVGHVLIRFHRFGADMPWQNAVVQFIAGVWGLLIGLTGGREGPGIHLGAFGGSIIGHTLGLPNNSVRILSGCGIAASIAAAFNTPLAGVIFAMEVIVKQYTLASFLPVIIAASIGALVTTTVFGPEPAFNIQIEHALTWGDVPVLVALGLFIGAMAAGYIQMVESTIARTWNWPVWTRFTAAGVATGLLGIWIPEVLGIGYDTTELIAGAQITLLGLIGIAMAKWLLASTTVGLGLPVGTIAPVLMIGSAIGGIAGALMYHYQQIPVADVAFYVVLGMGAMMGATLQAPLAALTAVLELTSDTAAIMPAMFIIVIAGLASRMLFGKEGLYDAMLRANDQQMQGPSLWFNGDNIGVSSVIDRQIGHLEHPCTLHALQNTLEDKPTWLVLEDEQKNTLGVIRSNPARSALEHAYTEAFNQAYAVLEEQQEKLRAHFSSTPNTDGQVMSESEDNPRGDLIPAIDTEALAAEVMRTTVIDLTEINAFYRAADVEVGYTLTQAQQVMRTLEVEVLVARRQTRSHSARPLGVLTMPMIEQAISERDP